MSVLRKGGWGIMTLLAFGVAGYATALVLVPGTRGDFQLGMLDRSPVLAHLHFLGGAIALVTGALQFHAGLRRARPVIHRWTGRVYLLGVGAGGVAALWLATETPGGPAARFGFGMLAVLWLWSTSVALKAILGGNVAAHRQWMIRSYALTLAAVTLRFQLPMAMSNGLSFEMAYPAIAWLCWVPNLVFAEWILMRDRKLPVAA